VPTLPKKLFLAVLVGGLGALALIGPALAGKPLNHNETFLRDGN